MRITLELDDLVVAAARAKAAADGTSLSRATSDLIRRGLTMGVAAEASAAAPAGFPVLQGVPSHVVTADLVAEHAEDD